MFHTVAFHKAAVSLTLLPLTPINDTQISTAAYDLTVPELNNIVAALAFGGAPTQVQLQSPSLRRVFLEDIGQAILTEVTTPAQDAIVDRRDSPIPLVVSEKLNVFTVHTTDGWVLLWLADGPIAPVSGDIRTIRATTHHTTTADIWENGDLTLAQTLPAGRYQIVGARAFGTNLLAARFVLVGEAWRPGVPAGADVNAIRNDFFRRGRFGSFGEFEFDSPPSIDLLATGVSADEEIYLDLIQVRAD